MERDGPPATGCRIGELFELLGRAHVLDILYLAIHEERPIRFADLQRRLGMSPNTLSHRLKSLHQAGLLTRTAYNEIPPRVDYEATAKARRLGDVFRMLHEWSQENTLTAEATDSAAALA